MKKDFFYEEEIEEASDGDVYSNEYLDQMLDEDAITALDAAFMSGYLAE